MLVDHGAHLFGRRRPGQVQSILLQFQSLVSRKAKRRARPGQVQNHRVIAQQRHAVCAECGGQGGLARAAWSRQRIGLALPCHGRGMERKEAVHGGYRGIGAAVQPQLFFRRVRIGVPVNGHALALVIEQAVSATGPQLENIALNSHRPTRCVCRRNAAISHARFMAEQGRAGMVQMGLRHALANARKAAPGQLRPVAQKLRQVSKYRVEKPLAALVPRHCPCLIARKGALRQPCPRR